VVRVGDFKVIQVVSSRGIHPRFITLANGDSTLLVANKDSDNIVVFNVNPVDGLIDDSSAFVNESSISDGCIIANPACVVPVY